MKEPGLTTAVLMCHAPIVLPEIAREAAASVQKSTEAMTGAAQRVLAARPDVLVIVSPHTPRHRRAFGVAASELLHGSFHAFGFPELTIDLPGAPGEAGLLAVEAEKLGVPVKPLPEHELDHGAMVPLHFLQEAGWSGPTLLISLPGLPELTDCETLGRALAAAAVSSGKRWALVASGDMSHRLIATAPAGYHPRAREFDAEVSRCVEAGRYSDALTIERGLRELAAEDVLESLAVASGAGGGRSEGRAFLSYEGPFGVGYLVSVLYASA